MIAKSALEARRARAEGKQVIVLALEGASGLLESEEDLHELIDNQGIRIVTFLHLTDDHLGGAAFFHSFKGLFMSPLSWLAQLFKPRRDETGAKVNKNGLTDDGERLARKLIERGVWIDLAHASDESQRGLIPLLKEAGQPLLYTHTALRRFEGTERALADWQLEEVRATHGIVGLMPSEQMMEGTPAVCADGLHRLARQFFLVAERIGPESTQLGSDFNGGINHLKPSHCASGVSVGTQGLWNIGQSLDTWRALKTLGVPWPAKDSAFGDAFLAAWSRVTPRKTASGVSANYKNP